MGFSVPTVFQILMEGQVVCCLYGIAADSADFPSAYSGRVIAFEPYLPLGTYLITIIYCSKPRISLVEI